MQNLPTEILQSLLHRAVDGGRVQHWQRRDQMLHPLQLCNKQDEQVGWVQLLHKCYSITDRVSNPLARSAIINYMLRSVKENLFDV